MWFIAGAKTKTRAVKGGRVGQRYCEGCKEVVTFRECDVADSFHAFFIDLFESTQRRMVCPKCGEDHDVEEFFKVASPLPRPHAKSPRSPATPPLPPQRSSVWDRLRGRVDASSAPGAREDDVDKELAALKEKLARKDRS